ncbi:AAA-type ATPase family protein [Musa troglodytarum]|uniref:AAA-type ATPase family protein n=1 Tax=Musa troglodytarum TaxID=320322 RepID=A0A9E7JVR2_9LILI|nr:AAA-type ATPase family protein [Musa troglodytarum]
MANFLDSEVYDLELTAIKDNTELRRLTVNTTSKSIIVIEDIDCSIHLSGTREIEGSKVTLSGLLNFIDGLCAACGGERLIVFTTNHVGKLDPALVRRGMMDMHIELGYCGFEAFKALAKNYLEVEEHPPLEKVKELLEKVKITPADVAEQLMPKKLLAYDKASRCLERLVQTLQNAMKVGRKEEGEGRNVAGRTEGLTIEVFYFIFPIRRITILDFFFSYLINI